MKALCVALLAAFALLSCESYHSERVVDVNPVLWSKGDTLRVEVENFDTLSLRKLQLLLRVDNSFSMRYLPCDINFYLSDNQKFEYASGFDLSRSDTLVYNSGMMDFCLDFLGGALMNKSTKYLVEFVPSQDVTGVWAVGIRQEF